MGDKVLQSACSSSSSLWTVTCHMGWVMGWLEAHRKCGGMRFRFCLGQLEWSSCILGVRSGAETHSSSPAQQDRYGQIKLAPLQSNESNGPSEGSIRKVPKCQEFAEGVPCTAESRSALFGCKIFSRLTR
jgi:hypothetical protein